MLPKHLELCCECSQETSQRIGSEARQVEKMAEHHLNLHKNRLRIESKMKGVMNAMIRVAPNHNTHSFPPQSNSTQTKQLLPPKNPQVMAKVGCPTTRFNQTLSSVFPTVTKSVQGSPLVQPKSNGKVTFKGLTCKLFPVVATNAVKH